LIEAESAQDVITAPANTAKAKLLSCFFINYPFIEMADYINLLRFVDTKRLPFKFVLL